ncbi:MAG: PAS domain-containing protein [Actinobacteria bacterium]|nr:PAS domain-containing protein [Actinomycetota bacterium]
MEHPGFDVAAAEALFRLGVDPMTILARRDDGHVEIVVVNPAAAAVTGWDAVDVRGRTVGELYPPDHAARTEGFVHELDGPGSVVNYCVEGEAPWGRRSYEVRLIGLGDRDGRFHALSISHDVTRRDAAESALEETQRLGRIGHFSWNLETDEITWTDQMYELFGLPGGSPVALDDVFGVVDVPPDFRDRMQLAIDSGTSYEIEFQLNRPDGGRRVAVARGRAFHGSDGQPVRVSGTVQDVTEQRAAESSAALLERARIRQGQALELNDDVLQGLATVRIALMQEEYDFAMDVVDRTLEAARDIISDLLRDHLGTGPVPGDLVRATSSGAEDEEE